MLILYASGILLAVLMARLFKRFLFNDEDIPFVMELPPYRMPTGKSIMIHMWEKAKQYLHKMGGVILIASIIIWFLGYFPRHSENGDVFDKQIAEVEQSAIPPEEKAETIAELERLKSMDHQQESYIGSHRSNHTTDTPSAGFRLEDERQPVDWYGCQRSCRQHVERLIYRRVGRQPSPDRTIETG